MNSVGSTGGSGSIPDDDGARRILNVTHELIRKRGAQGVTTDSVAHEAGVSKSTVYRRWKTKEALVFDAIIAAASVRSLPPGPFEYRLRQYLEGRRRRLSMAGTVNLISALLGLVEARDGSKQINAQWLGVVKIALTEAVASGEIRADLSIDDLATVVGSPLFYRVVMENSELDDEFMDSVVQIILFGIVPR